MELLNKMYSEFTEFKIETSKSFNMVNEKLDKVVVLQKI
jgi:hypothetical protein